MKNFLALPNLVDHRGSLPKKGSYPKRPGSITTRVWHHSLTLSHLTGSTAVAFANFHINSNGWPGVAYHVIIEPRNIVNTPRGKRARIVWAHDFDRRCYHAGVANDYSLGICVAGDYRNEQMAEYVKATVDELQEALVKDGIGSSDKSHNEMPGYSWKACCVFDYKEVFTFLNQNVPVAAIPGTYKIQEGDTFWNIANNLDGISVEDLLAANPGIDPASLQIGQVIKLGKAKGEAAKQEKPVQTSKPSTVKVGQTVTLSRAATRYATGETIPAIVKGKKYTVLQVGENRVLLKEILSWVNTKDVGGAGTVTTNIGKRVEAIAAVVNFYDLPRWTNPTGQFTRGTGFTLLEEIITDGAKQFKVKNSKGKIFYTTARKDLVVVK